LRGINFQNAAGDQRIDSVTQDMLSFAKASSVIVDSDGMGAAPT
jgi:hypothetical protein